MVEMLLIPLTSVLFHSHRSFNGTNGCPASLAAKSDHVTRSDEWHMSKTETATLCPEKQYALPFRFPFFLQHHDNKAEVGVRLPISS